MGIGLGLLLAGALAAASFGGMRHPTLATDVPPPVRTDHPAPLVHGPCWSAIVDQRPPPAPPTPGGAPRRWCSSSPVQVLPEWCYLHRSECIRDFDRYGYPRTQCPPSVYVVPPFRPDK